MAHEKIAFRCSACLWGMATLVEVAGKIKVKIGGWCMRGDHKETLKFRNQSHILLLKAW